jgi:archaellin
VTGLTSKLGADKTFALEVKPQQGAVLNVERTTPARIDTVTDLH